MVPTLTLSSVNLLTKGSHGAFAASAFPTDKYFHDGLSNLPKNGISDIEHYSCVAWTLCDMQV